MRTRRSVIQLLLCASASSALAQDKLAAARSFVDVVFKLYDQGDYGKMYDDFSSAMQQKMSREQWIDAVKKVAAQTGKVTSRSLGQKANSMGAYRFIFNAACTQGKVFEDITVTDTEGDAWKVAGFWVRPNLEP